MKNLSIRPFRVIVNLFLALVFAVATAAVFPVINPLAFAAITFGIAFIPGVLPSIGALTMAIQTEVWIRDIEDNLFEGNEFINMSVNDDSEANNKTVHVPQSGTQPAITVDRAVFPATAAQRTDTVLDYSLRSFSTDPIHVTRIEDVQTSYSKRTSVMGESVAVLNERIGTETAFAWAPEGTAELVLRTTGANTGALPHATATGTRNRVVADDIARMAKKLDKDLVPANGRFLLMTTDMYYELFTIDALVRKDFVGNTKAIPQGVINFLFGFNIMVRPTTVLYDNAAGGIKKAIGSADATTDTNSIIGWSQFAVRKALESIQVFAKDRDPQFFGDVISAEVIYGASKSRSDNRGIVTLAQKHNV